MTHPRELHILSYNIHKGFSVSGKRFVLKEIRDILRDLNVDLVFLQEVVGKPTTRIVKAGNSESAQYEFLADSIWRDHRYGQNAAYQGGHHGNAILSRFPISESENFDLSTNRHERRGILHTIINTKGDFPNIHACCTHLDLTRRGRATQLKAITGWLEKKVPRNDPLILAGDFNDWLKQASSILRKNLRLREVVEHSAGRLRGTFPAILPILTLDRIYVRGLKIIEARILKERMWRRLSDHVPVYARLSLD